MNFTDFKWNDWCRCRWHIHPFNITGHAQAHHTSALHWWECNYTQHIYQRWKNYLLVCCSAVDVSFYFFVFKIISRLKSVTLHYFVDGYLCVHGVNWCRDKTGLQMIKWADWKKIRREQRTNKMKRKMFTFWYCSVRNCDYYFIIIKYMFVGGSDECAQMTPTFMHQSSQNKTY